MDGEIGSRTRVLAPADASTWSVNAGLIEIVARAFLIEMVNGKETMQEVIGWSNACSLKELEII